MNGDPQERRRGCMEDFGRKIDEQIQNGIPQVEAEVRRVITYLNDEVVPQVRRNSSEALKIASVQLAKLAEALDKGNRPPSADGNR
jgi:hypothetical protein